MDEPVRFLDRPITWLVRRARRVPPGPVVVVSVMLLLQGPRAAWEHTLEFGADMLGGGPEVRGVLCQATAVVLAIAAVTFAIRARLARFESPWSLVLCAAVLLGGFVVGAELRCYAKQDDASAVRPVVAGEATVPVSDALRVLFSPAGWSAVSEEDEWPRETPRVALFGEEHLPLGIVGRAANQLLGYLVVYKPRLFLAALVAGGYLGWTWQGFSAKVAGERGRSECRAEHGSRRRAA